jgi:toxin ParE1/3/4
VKLRVDPAALEEIRDAETWCLKEFGPFVTRDFRLKTAEALEEITQYPKRYKVVRKRIRMKVLEPYPYSIVYEEINDIVRVHAFAHHKRRPGYWNKRTK